MAAAINASFGNSITPLIDFKSNKSIIRAINLVPVKSHLVQLQNRGVMKEKIIRALEFVAELSRGIGAPMFALAMEMEKGLEDKYDDPGYIGIKSTLPHRFDIRAALRKTRSKSGRYLLKTVASEEGEKRHRVTIFSLEKEHCDIFSLLGWAAVEIDLQLVRVIPNEKPGGKTAEIWCPDIDKRVALVFMLEKFFRHNYPNFQNEVEYSSIRSITYLDVPTARGQLVRIAFRNTDPH